VHRGRSSHPLSIRIFPGTSAYRLRLGFDGYRKVQGYAREVATRLSANIGELGPFELITKGDELPVFAFKLRDEVVNYTVFDVSNALRERGWQVPAYAFPKDREDLAALRVVVRRGFTRDLADLLVSDIEHSSPAWRNSRRRSTTPQAPRVSTTSKGVEGV
jgi:glutamate/tyrosine decarboxylase-like PLP-dependent enzyme